MVGPVDFERPGMWSVSAVSHRHTKQVMAVIVYPLLARSVGDSRNIATAGTRHTFAEDVPGGPRRMLCLMASHPIDSERPAEMLELSAECPMSVPAMA